MGNTSELGALVASNNTTINNVEYKAGEVVDVSGLPDHKIEQLLRLRKIRPQVQG